MFGNGVEKLLRFSDVYYDVLRLFSASLFSIMNRKKHYMEESNTPNKGIIAIVVVALLVFAATATIVMTSRPQTQDAATTQASDLPTTAGATTSTASENTTSPTSNGLFTDGTYSATGSYQTPGGIEKIGVKVTINNGVVTTASITEQGSTGESQEFQARFESGFESQVVGKKVSEIKLSRVAGSSLTPIGFNAAISDIAKQAQI